MANISKSNVQRLEQDIRQLLNEGKDDSTLRQILRIELRTYQRYVKRIHEENRQIFYSITRDEVETQLLLLKSSLEHTYRIALSMAEDKEYNSRLEALQIKDQARILIVQLLLSGPELIPKIQRQLKDTKPYVEDYSWKKNADRLFRKKR